MQKSNQQAAQDLVRIGRHLRFFAFGYLSLVALPAYFCFDLFNKCFSSEDKWEQCQQLSNQVWRSAKQEPLEDVINPIAWSLMLSISLPQAMVFSLIWAVMTSLLLIAEVMGKQQILSYNDFGHRK